jgi:hypothetical protein
MSPPQALQMPLEYLPQQLALQRIQPQRESIRAPQSDALLASCPLLRLVA